MIKNKIWRIPVISVFTGIITTIVGLLITYFLAKGTSEWTLAMSNKTQWIDIVVSLVLFIITGLVYLKNMNRIDIIKSATIVTIYYIVIIGLEQLLINNGFYPPILFFLFCPVRIYSGLVGILEKFVDISIWTSVVFSIFCPYLYIVFSKRIVSKGRMS